MDRTTRSPQPPRSAVLIVSHGDGYIEAFAERNIDVHIARVPVAHSREAEQNAEHVAELLLPVRYRPLFQRDRLRAAGTTQPLLPSALQQSFVVRDCVQRLNQLTGANAESEVVVWT